MPGVSDVAGRRDRERDHRRHRAVRLMARQEGEGSALRRVEGDHVVEHGARPVHDPSAADHLHRRAVAARRQVRLLDPGHAGEQVGRRGGSVVVVDVDDVVDVGGVVVVLAATAVVGVLVVVLVVLVVVKRRRPTTLHRSPRPPPPRRGRWDRANTERPTGDIWGEVIQRARRGRGTQRRSIWSLWFSTSSRVDVARLLPNGDLVTHVLDIEKESDQIGLWWTTLRRCRQVGLVACSVYVAARRSGWSRRLHSPSSSATMASPGGVPRHATVLLERVERQPGVLQRGDDLAEAVVEPHRSGRREVARRARRRSSVSEKSVPAGVSKYGYSTTSSPSGRGSHSDHTTGWPSRMNSRPPGRSSAGHDVGPAARRRAASTTRRCRCRRGRSVRRRAPRRRRTPRRARSRSPCRTSAASWRPTSSAGGEKSSPVIRAPRRASDSVSVPMWHCRWTASRPRDVAEARHVEADDAGQEVGSVRKRSRS